MRALAIVCAAGLVAGCDGQGAQTTSADQHEQTETSEASTGLTMAKYQQIRDGMSYREVVDILGQEGVEMSSTDIGGTRTVMYMWEGNGGANMNAMFQGDKLVQKAQFGLR